MERRRRRIDVGGAHTFVGDVPVVDVGFVKIDFFLQILGNGEEERCHVCHSVGPLLLQRARSACPYFCMDGSGDPLGV